jgi:cell division protease FtsH
MGRKIIRMKKIFDFLRDYWMAVLILFIITGSTLYSMQLKEEYNHDKKVAETIDDGEFKKMSYNEFLKKVENKEIKEVMINYNAPTFYVIDKKKQQYITDNPRTEGFKEFLLKNDVKVVEDNPSISGNIFITFVITFIIFFVLSFLFKKNSYQMQINNQLVQTKIAEQIKTSPVTFKDIAGNESVKKDVQFIVDFLKNPSKYQKIGARMPKGVIFYGPPGTGKTLLAKAIAGEAGVPFFSVSGSDFVEMYVGVGARRVRDLFAEARKKAPCIIFIDEIDAVGKKRGIDNNTEKDQTINALLTQLDGFSSSDGIVVIGATNRLDILDEALIRPGRFDKHIAIPLPEYKERLEILKLHTKNKKLADSVNLEAIAKMTIGFSGAGLETLMNESAIIAVSKGKETIDMEDIDDAFYKVVMKGDKKSVKDTNQEQLKLVAWHEAGHALVAKLLTNKSVPKVTIVPSTSGAGGVTFIIPEKMGLHTKKDLINEIKICYAGRIAEYLLTKDESLITTGASQDIKQATNLIIRMIKEFGMTSEFGMLYMDALSSVTENEVLKEAKNISKQIYDETLEFMEEHQATLEELANTLLEKETIEEEELNQIVFKTLKVS